MEIEKTGAFDHLGSMDSLLLALPSVLRDQTSSSMLRFARSYFVISFR